MGLNQAELPNGVASPERRRHAKEDETTTRTTAPSFRPYFDTLLQRSSDPFVRTLRTQPVEAFANNPGSGTSSAGPSSKDASIFSGHATTSTYPTQYATEYSLPNPKPAGLATSTMNATDGSGSTTSSDDIEYVWDSGDRSNQFNCANDKVPGRYNKRKLREVVLHQDRDRDTSMQVPITSTNEPLSNIRKTVVALLALIGLVTIMFALLQCYFLDAAVAENMRQIKLTLCFSTHIAALCAGVGMMVGRRTTIEVIGAFIAVLLIGGNIGTNLLG